MSAEPADLLPIHLLIVDDEAISALALERFLGRKGFRVSVAGDGEKALAIQERDPARLVVTDVRMPRCSGGELVQRLRREDPSLPVIVMTGYMAADAETAGFTGPNTVVLQKPLDVEELLAHIRRLVA
ncbi:MAG TPA: response regulator [Azospirillaceae bacterium]|nr:response regulator [Azospirillaceae bacterium]